jgi:uncharacterized damage-inducible protein DinB
MPITDALLPELDHELAVTRKLLERVPEAKVDWRPHGKSFSLGQLVAHVSNLARWGELTLEQSELDLAGQSSPAVLTSREEALSAFDASARAFRAALVGRTDAELMAPWTLKQKGAPIFTMPKAAVLRSFVMNHLIHHRGQLSVYLRLLDVPLPSIYGPSADEKPF